MTNAAQYVTVTEIPGNMISKEQLERLYQRYRFAAQYCKGKDVLEVACGAGQGLGYLAKTARCIVGGDIDDGCLAFAKKKYEGIQGVVIGKFDAQSIPYPDSSFDTVILYEAVYYLGDAARFVNEAHRVLRKGGALIVCSANRELSNFNPSPHSTKYLSAMELAKLLEARFCNVELFGGFPVSSGGLIDRIVSLIKRVAVSLHLVPKTMKGKEFLKRIFFGKLQPMPAEVTDEMAQYTPLEAVSPDKPDTVHKVIFAVGRKG